MTDFARLVLAADSTQMRGAANDVDKLAATGERTEKRTKKSTDKMSDHYSRSGGRIKAAIGRISGHLVALGAAAVSVGAAGRVLIDFERSMARVEAITGATAGELSTLRQTAADMGASTEFSAGQAADALTFLGMAGFQASESVAALPAVLDLATAAQMDLARSADVTSNIMSAFGIEAERSAAVADVLAAASSSANTSVEQLGTAMSFAGPIASALEVSIGDTAAAIGVLSDAGIQGSAAGTGLRRVLSRLSNPTSAAASEIEGLGLSIAELNPQTNDLIEIVDRLADSGMSAAQAMKIFGDRGGPAILALTSQVDGLRRLTGELENVDGRAKDMADTMRDNLGGDIDSLISSVQGLVIALGDAGLTAVLRGLVKLVTGVSRGITDLINDVSGAAGAISGFVGELLGFATAEQIHQRAIDNVTLAMGDQIWATRRLNAVLKDGMPLTLDAVEAKINEAKARRENVQQLVRERQEAELAANGYYDLIDRIGATRDALASLRTPGDDLEDMPANIRASYEETERALASMLNRQQEMLDKVREKGHLDEQEAAHLAEIEANLAALRARQRELNGETEDGVKLSDRLSLSIQGISFASANSGAERLAELLGVSVTQARLLKGLLPNEGEPEGLSFGLGSAGVGGVTYGSGLSFGNNPGEIPIPGVSDTSSSGASAAEKQANATQKVIDNLRMELDLIGATETARRTKQALQRAGVDLYSEEGQAIADLVEQIDSLEGAQKRAEQMSQAFKDSIIDAAMGGADAFDRLKDAIKRAALEYLLFGEGMFAGGGSGGFGGLLGGIFDSFDGGGYTGSGSRTGGVDGKGGFPALLHPQETVIDHARGQSAPQAAPRAEIIVRSEPGTVVEIARQEAVTVTREGISGYDRQLPGRVQQINRDPRRK